MFQFWFNTFFISTGTNLDDKETETSDPTLQSFTDDETTEDNATIRWFILPKQFIDKAHKDDRCRIFQPDFRVIIKPLGMIMMIIVIMIKRIVIM